MLNAPTCIKCIHLPKYGDDKDPENWGANIETQLLLKGSFLHSANPLVIYLMTNHREINTFPSPPLSWSSSPF